MSTGEERLDRWPRRLATLQLAAGLLFLVTFVLFCVWARFPVPYRDDWDWYLWLLDRPLTVRRLFEPHNEHVILVLRTLFALQYRLAGSGTHLVFGAAVLSQLLVGWICWREVRRRWQDDGIARFVFGVAGVLLFFSFQLQSYVMMSAALFPLVQVFALASITCMLNASEPGGRCRRLWLVLAAVASTGAALTVTNGLVVPVIIALVAWRRREGRAVVFGFLVAAVAGAVAYLSIVSRGGTAASWRQQPLGAIAGYFLTFFGSGVAYASTGAALVWGAILLVAGCAAILLTTDRRRAPSRLEVFSVAVLGFVMVSAAMAAPARAQFGALQAAQSRYGTYAMTYWVALLFWGASRTSERTWRRYLRPPLLLGTLLATVVAFLLHVFIALVWRAKADNIGIAGLALESGVTDDEWIVTLHPSSAVVYSAHRLLREAGGPARGSTRIGTPLHADPALAKCDASMSRTRVAGNGGWRATGVVTAAAADTGLIVDKDGIVRGLARTLPVVSSPDPTEPQVVRAVWKSFGQSADAGPSWLGFAGTGGAEPYTLYPVDGSGRPLCWTALASREPVRIWLDQPDGIVGTIAAGAGWAFQCDGEVERLALLIDGTEQRPLRIERNRPRPDVDAAFAALCDIGDPGIVFELDTRTLSPGTHDVRLRAFGRGGRVADSNARTIQVSR
jgi:hypothetical protein